MVRETITDPNNIRQAWRTMKNELLAAFLHQRRNDPDELAKEIGVSLFEAQEELKEASRIRTPTKRVPDDKIDELFEPKGTSGRRDAVVNTAGRGIAPDPYSRSPPPSTRSRRATWRSDWPPSAICCGGLAGGNHDGARCLLSGGRLVLDCTPRPDHPPETAPRLFRVRE